MTWAKMTCAKMKHVKRVWKGPLYAAALLAMPTLALAQGTGTPAGAPAAVAKPDAAQQAAAAEGMSVGMLTVVDRVHGVIAIRQNQDATVGGGSGGTTEQIFKAPDGTLEKLHAGDRVKFAVSDNGGKKTITKIDSL